MQFVFIWKEAALTLIRLRSHARIPCCTASFETSFLSSVIFSIIPVEVMQSDIENWAALRERVPNVLSRCHTGNPPILLLVWQRLFRIFLFFFENFLFFIFLFFFFFFLFFLFFFFFSFFIIFIIFFFKFFFFFFFYFFFKSV